jgi:hypothetical protein
MAELFRHGSLKKSKTSRVKDMLASGLPDIVANDEDLARFLMSSRHHNSQIAKPSAFLPSPNDRETSVFRHGSEPRDELWTIGERDAAKGRTLHGAAIVKANNVRAARLEIIAAEPPPRHAAITGWPWLDSDPQLQKAQQIERAMQVAGKATLLRR